MNTQSAILSPSPVTPDRSALLAALTVNGRASTPKGHAFHARGASASVNTGNRPYSVTPTNPPGLTTWHESPALAIARLATL